MTATPTIGRKIFVVRPRKSVSVTTSPLTRRRWDTEGTTPRGGEPSIFAWTISHICRHDHRLFYGTSFTELTGSHDRFRQLWRAQRSGCFLRYHRVTQAIQFVCDGGDWFGSLRTADTWDRTLFSPNIVLPHCRCAIADWLFQRLHFW